MGKSSKQAAGSSPKSFSFHLPKGDTLGYRGGTITPSVAYSVLGTPEDLTTEVLEEWFIQSVQPLVGPDAAATLKELVHQQSVLAEKFLSAALSFRKSLK